MHSIKNMRLQEIYEKVSGNKVCPAPFLLILPIYVIYKSLLEYLSIGKKEVSEPLVRF